MEYMKLKTKMKYPGWTEKEFIEHIERINDQNNEAVKALQKAVVQLTRQNAGLIEKVRELKQLVTEES